MDSRFDSKNEFIEELRLDFKFVESNLNSDFSEFWSRTFIRTSISLIEAELFILKQDLIIYCRDNAIQISPEIALLLDSKKYEINSNGQVKERLLQVRLNDDIRFCFGQIKSFKGYKLYKEFDDSGWSKVISTIAVRNRLTHPKSSEDIVVSNQEVVDCKLAFNWFIKNVVFFLEQDKDEIERESNKKIKELEARRDQLIEKRAKDT